jgi:tRNA(Ile2) C34 agmatinyltransferase TiaS
MITYIGLDDTDNHESRGTGRLARQIAGELAAEFTLLGVTRHQLLVDPRIPYTSHNSSAAIALESPSQPDLEKLFARVRAIMLADFQPGSDPGLCVVANIPPEVTDFGRRAQREVVTRQEAFDLAVSHAILLEGLGGTDDGVIGALAAVGLAACGEDGRYLLLGKIRELSGLIPVGDLMAAGITGVQTLDGRPVVLDGLVASEKLRPARRGGRPIQFVAWQDGCWAPLKLD